MSIRYGQICPVSKAAELLGERWTLLFIRELVLGTTRLKISSARYRKSRQPC